HGRQGSVLGDATKPRPGSGQDTAVRRRQRGLGNRRPRPPLQDHDGREGAVNAMQTRNLRVLAATLAALLPACGGGGGDGSGGTSGGGTTNPAFPVTMTEPSRGQTF